MQSSGQLILTLSGGGEKAFSLGQGVVTLGRAPTNDIVIDDVKVSRTHARLEPGAEGWTLIDLKSANGTVFQGARVERVALQPGDTVQLGGSTLRFEPATLQPAAEMTVIQSEADLEATLAHATLAVAVNRPDVPRLAVYTPGRTWEIPLVEESLSIGRQPANDVVLDRAKVSRQHARIERRGDLFVIRDLQSTNGVWLGSRRIDEHTLHNGDTVRVGDAQLVFKGVLAADELTLVEPPTGAKQGRRRPVIFVPGLMGSQLWLGSEKVWPNVRHLFTNPELFRLPDRHALEPRGIVGEVVLVPNVIELEQYNPLFDFLEESLGYERGMDLLDFAYDWRQDVRHAARRLAETVDRWPVTPPITIIAHSLGCLVSRYYVERLGGKDKVERVILLGGPHQGAPKALMALLFGPNLLPFGLLGERLREVMATFPSCYQILPSYECIVDQHGRPVDLRTDDTWLAEDRRALLRAGWEFRQELGTHSSVPAVSIFGYGLKTVTRLQVERGTDGQWQRVDLNSEAGGDNTVPEVSTVLPGSDVHPVEQHHGALYIDNDVKMRLKVELTWR